jgi:GNAT superfamily N-acetyltransferase
MGSEQSCPFSIRNHGYDPGDIEHGYNCPMSAPLTYRLLQPDEAAAATALVRRVFDDFVAPGYSQIGVAEFYRYADPDALTARQNNNHFTLVCLDGERMVGMIEMRANEHIALLFVDPAYQRRGIAAVLWGRALQICRENNPNLKTVTVNSSPFAVPVYARFGFKSLSGKVEKNGFRFIPMGLDLASYLDEKADD